MPALIARKYQVSPHLLERWRGEWRTKGKLSRAGFAKLKKIEGPGYRPQRISVEDAAGATKLATTFRVRMVRRESGRYTTAKYVGHIVCGLRAHDVPEEYVQHVIDIALQTNQRATETAVAAEQNRRIEGLRAKK